MCVCERVNWAKRIGSILRRSHHRKPLLLTVGNPQAWPCPLPIGQEVKQRRQEVQRWRCLSRGRRSSTQLRHLLRLELQEVALQLGTEWRWWRRVGGVAKQVRMRLRGLQRLRLHTQWLMAMALLYMPSQVVLAAEALRAVLAQEVLAARVHH